MTVGWYGGAGSPRGHAALWLGACRAASSAWTDLQ